MTPRTFLRSTTVEAVHEGIGNVRLAGWGVAEATRLPALANNGPELHTPRFVGSSGKRRYGHISIPYPYIGSAYLTARATKGDMREAIGFK
jgi:hypothetical protein